jgi:hypothetical protein
MAQAEVEIVYKANATSLEASVGKINQTNNELVVGAAATSKKVADEFKKIGSAAAAAFGSQQVKAALDQLNNESIKLTSKLKELQKEQVLLISSGNRVSKSYEENAKAQAVLKAQITQVNNEQQILNQTFENTETKQKTLTAQFNELKLELNALQQAGKENTVEFENLTIEAAKLQDKIGDTREAVRVLSSDSFKFDAALGAVRALASGFALAQGTAALFGAENENLKEVISKTTAVIAIANGVNQLSNELTGNTATKLGIAAVAKKLFTVQTVAGTVALSAFRIALAATGIGIFIAAIALVATYLANAADRQKKLSEAIDLANLTYNNSVRFLKKLTDQTQEYQDKIDVLSKKTTQSAIDRRDAIKLVQKEFDENVKKELGANAKIISSTQLDANKRRKIELETQKEKFGRLGNIQQAELDTLNDTIFLTEALLKRSAKEQEKITIQKNDQIAKINILFDEQERLAKIEKDKETAAKALEISNKAAQDRLKIVEETIKKELLIDGESQQERIALAKNLADQDKLNAEQTIKDAELKAATIARIEQELANNIEAIKLDERKKASETRILELEAIQAAGKLEIDQAIELAKARAEAEKIAAGGETDPAKRKALEAKAEADGEAAIKKIKAEGFQADVQLFTARLKLQQELGDFSVATQKKLVEVEFKGREVALTAAADQTIQGQKKLTEDLKKLKLDEKKALEAIDQSAVNKAIELDILRIQTLQALGKASLQDKKQLINDELKLKINAIDQELVTDEEKEQKRALARALANKQIETLDKETTQKQIDNALEIATATANVFGAILDLQKQVSDNRIADVERTRDAEIEAINQSTDLEIDKIRQREAATLRANKRIAEEKTKQAKRDKALAIFEATINTASAIIKTGAQLGYPAAIPFQVAAGIVGALQIATIAAQPIPKFKKGGEVGGRSHEAGGTMIEAEKGEFVVNKSSVARHRDALDAMNRSSLAFKKYIDDRYVRPALMDFANKNKGASVTVNASLNSKSMEKEIKGLRKDLKGRSTVVNINASDSRYEWQRN